MKSFVVAGDGFVNETRFVRTACGLHWVGSRRDVSRNGVTFVRCFLPNEKFSEEATGLFKLFDKSLPSWSSRHDPAVRCSTYRREMLHRNAGLCDLPVELKVLVLSHIEHVETGQILGLSSDVWEALSLLRALQQAFYFEGALSEFADHLVRLLDDDRVRSLGKERALELIGVYSNRLCEYACGRNFCLLYTSPSPRDQRGSRMPSSA